MPEDSGTHGGGGVGVRSAALGAAAFAAVGFAADAAGEMRVVETDGFVLNLSLTAAFGAFNTENTNFGAGFVQPRGTTNRDVDWIDGFLRPGANFAYRTETAGEVYGGLAYVLSATQGQDAAVGLNPNDPKNVYNDEFKLGWRSANLWPGLGDDALDISFGRQPFQVADGFILWDGALNAFEKSGWWLNPSKSFERAGVIRLNTEPVHGEGFYLRTDGNFASSEAFGLNLEAEAEEWGTVGAMVMHFTQSDLPTRDGMDLFDLRANGTPLAFLPDFSLWGEFVHQRNDGHKNDGGGDLSAFAWYVEPGYAFPEIPWSPRLAYRYTHFSGDDPETARSEAYDYLFYGFGRGWGTWVQGEVIGEYVLFNSNVNAHVGHLTLTPFDSFDLHLFYYRFFLDEPSAFAANAGPARDEAFADEVDLAVFWTPNEHLTIYGAAAAAIPDTAARQAFGENEMFYTFELIAYYSF
jgi:hypothetical protein